MRNIPLIVLLSFPTPNYDNPETQGDSSLIVNSVLISMVTIAIVLRLYTRISIKKRFGLDDILIILAYIATVGLTATVILANTKYGWNKHVWDIRIPDLTTSLKVAFCAKIFFVLATSLTRISILCFYYRLAGESSIAWFRWAVHISMAFSIGILITYLALTIWTCVPIYAYWTYPALPNQRCIDEGNVMLIAGILNCIADFAVTVIPIPVIARLEMPIRQRVGVIALLSLGFIVTAAGAVRSFYIWKSLINSYDQTWYAYPLWIAAAVEIDIGVICACAPPIRPLFTKLLHSNALSIISTNVSSTLNSRFTPASGDEPPKTQAPDRKTYHDLPEIPHIEYSTSTLVANFSTTSSSPIEEVELSNWRSNIAPQHGHYETGHSGTAR